MTTTALASGLGRYWWKRDRFAGALRVPRHAQTLSLDDRDVLMYPSRGGCGT
jgi:hypothetical protein